MFCQKEQARFLKYEVVVIKFPICFLSIFLLEQTNINKLYIATFVNIRSLNY
ncbi:hypothetical protein M23134_01192 [Microscilla marina ATCC 23134]|uniref:Uncharacterized protein n=1 Tax=Microscilla marina ATCC 23134 TaxID=313606 RepID=A1ZFU4_MICM2|nr:hypothetical protein M23134_01192 [Microscilla marina ATCC 23134]